MTISLHQTPARVAQKSHLWQPNRASYRITTVSIFEYKKVPKRTHL